MSFSATYPATEPARAEVDGASDPVVLEFGTATCGFCRAAQPAIAAALTDHAGVRHIKVADGRGRPLGRSFGVKLWPTLVFIKEGKEVARLVRPYEPAPIRRALEQIDGR